MLPESSPERPHPLPESPPPPPPSLDALLPPDMARKAETLGVKKAAMPADTTLALAVLAGAFIALGGVFALTVGAGAGALPYGVGRLLQGLVFSLGLILVVVGGAELFTGNNLIVMAWMNRRVSTGALLRNWSLVYLGNAAGALATAGLVFLSGQYRFGKAAIGAVALASAEHRLSLGFGQAVALGVLCNALVCLAVWMTYSARSTTDRVLAAMLPIAAFVAAGFEHSIANLFSVPLALLIRDFAPASFWTDLEALTGRAADSYASLTWSGFLLDNLLPVTLGNIVGGGVLVGAVYWFVYLRRA